MGHGRDDDYLVGLVQELRRYPSETEWFEFKENNADPREIGEYASALANSAAINQKAHGYVVWGVRDSTHEVVGTTFDPSTTRYGNEPLENWLMRLTKPRVHMRFFKVEIDGLRVVILEIGRAMDRPVSFSGIEYIRVGEVKKCLKEAPEREQELWQILNVTNFESILAAEHVDSAYVLETLDYPAYFELLGRPLPSNAQHVLDAMAEERLVCRCNAGGWNITNVGAALLAKRLSDFPNLARKAVRVVQYKGSSRIETLREQIGMKGYASGFQGLIGFIMGLIPQNEMILKAIRQSVPMYPELAIRELVANALIHQDFLITGAGPMVEIFADRLEITNPGEPLVDTRRFIDTPPRSRNELLASLMRRFGICEERGSGIDKVIAQVELFQLPAPLFEVPDGFVRATLFAHKDLRDMTA